MMRESKGLFPAGRGGDLPGDDLPPELAGQVRRVAALQRPVLVSGERGTGKTRLARLLHELSPRRDAPFLVVNCGALPARLIEAELFGRGRGAFTAAARDRPGKFAAADGGTLLLDDVHALPFLLQSKLLRASAEQAGSPRPVSPPALIGTTSADLEREAAAGRFHADLYRRLNVIPLSLPPLRRWRAGIAHLAERFLQEFSGRRRPDVRGFTAEALRVLQEYDWPGNVRELRNVIERAVVLSPGPEVGLTDLPATVRRDAG
jgi:DNA-binding NtrC family response regulator